MRDEKDKETIVRSVVDQSTVLFYQNRRDVFSLLLFLHRLVIVSLIK